MKNIFKLLGLFLLGGMMFTSCSEDEKTFETLEPRGAIVSTANVVTGFYDLGDLPNASVAFDVNTHGEAASGVKVFKSYNGGARVEHASLSTFPSTITIPIADALAGLNVAETDLAVGDVFTFSFEITTGSGTYQASKRVEIPVSCTSALAGTYNYATSSTWCGSDPLTGTVEWIEDAAGIYSVSDWSYGAYDDCYGGPAAAWGTLQIQDVCNTITQLGADNYGDSWTFVITSVDGADLSFTWDNTYGEGGSVVLSRTDGTDWPPLRN